MNVGHQTRTAAKKPLKAIKGKESRTPSASLDYAVLNRIAERAFFMALEMIDIANHKRPEPGRGEPKVGGHATACASSLHILSAIHLVMRNPEDYLACKPHVSPVDHALNYLLHNFRDGNGELVDDNQRKLAMHHLRHYSPEGEPVFQSYHAESDPDSYRFFPSGSVGIPPVTALYTALAYDFAEHHGLAPKESPTFWCLMGDSEFREGSLMEAMPDAGERELGRLVWIVDYNRQNLDGTRIANEKALEGSDADRMLRIAHANGWQAIKLKHGKKRERLFAKPGGEEFKRVLDDEFTDFEFQALMGANRPELTRKVLNQKSAKLKAWLNPLSDEELHAAFLNLAGHDLESLIETLQAAKKETSRPTLIAAYTIKGWGLQCQALSGNHSTLPEEEELKTFAERIGCSHENPFEEFDSDSDEENYLKERRDALLPGIQNILKEVRKRKEGFAALVKKEIKWPVDFGITALKFNPVAHTQWMWGQIAAKLDRLASSQRKPDNNNPTEELDVKQLTETERAWLKVAPFFLTMAPDVGTSTNTSPNMNGKLYGDIEQQDFELLFGAKDKKSPDVVPRLSQRAGHLRFEIAEGNCMSAAGAFGKFKYFTGIPFYPAMTIYDFFIKRAHDQFYYNLYWHSHFATIGTPSGVTLAPEGAQHSWKSDFQIPHVVTWEPCFAKELEWILADTLRRHFASEDEEKESALIRCVTKGLVQKEFLDRLKQQPRFSSLNDDEIFESIRKEVLQGGYALIDYRQEPDYVPGDNAVHIFAMGALGPEAIRASDALLEKGIRANVFIVTSSDLLLGNFADADGYSHLRQGLGVTGDLYLNPEKGSEVRSDADWYSLRGSRVPIVSVHDGEPGLLDNIGSVVGVKQKALAVRKTSKSGTTPAIFHFQHIDADSVVEACESILKETAEEELKVSRSVLEKIR